MQLVHRSLKAKIEEAAHRPVQTENKTKSLKLKLRSLLYCAHDKEMEEDFKAADTALHRNV